VSCRWPDNLGEKEPQKVETCDVTLFYNNVGTSSEQISVRLIQKQPLLSIFYYPLETLFKILACHRTAPNYVACVRLNRVQMETLDVLALITFGPSHLLLHTYLLDLVFVHTPCHIGLVGEHEQTCPRESLWRTLAARYDA
jgi:hypothetical protein